MNISVPRKGIRRRKFAPARPVRMRAATACPEWTQGSPMLPNLRCLRGEVISFRRTRGERGGGAVCGDSGLDAVEAAQQVGAGGVEGVIVGQVRLVDQVR